MELCNYANYAIHLYVFCLSLLNIEKRKSDYVIM